MIIAVALLLVVASTGPHLVHHLFDAGRGQSCLLAAQANHCPTLTAIGLSIGLVATIRALGPLLPLLGRHVHATVTGLPHGPPSVYP